MAKEKLIKLLKHILPRKLNIEARLGFYDPSVTGSILAISGMLYPLINRHIHVYGDFENQCIDINGNFKGRICIFKILIIALQVYFNKNIKKVIKLFREV